MANPRRKKSRRKATKKTAKRTRKKARKKRAHRGPPEAAVASGGALKIATDGVAAFAIGFKKTSGPDVVRITLQDTGEVVLKPSSSSGTSQPRQAGAKINAFVEVRSNKPNDKAVVAVTNATPARIEISSEPGTDGNRFTLPLTVKNSV